MSVRTVMRITMDGPEEAKMVVDALSVDDDGYISTRVEGKVIVADIDTERLESGRRAADDWLACLMSIVRKQ
ncbi:MAG: hypothetical protein KAH57_06215 [Thermoplasmata archaeon]|nr:hypothetical protein [Thermoplasmata archaeon]